MDSTIPICLGVFTGSLLAYNGNEKFIFENYNCVIYPYWGGLLGWMFSKDPIIIGGVTISITSAFLIKKYLL